MALTILLSYVLIDCQGQTVRSNGITTFVYDCV